MDNLHYAPLTGTPFVWDKFLPVNTVIKDMDGLWHVGEGTDIEIILFEFSLTKSDHKFLKALRIEKE
jgi:hypothetical protein